MHCRVCDPEVGVGLKPLVCPSFCASWFGACAKSYFEFETRSGELLPCATDSQSGGVCAQLDQMVAGGAELCKRSKLEVSGTSGQPCFDGLARPVLASCSERRTAKSVQEGEGSGASSWADERFIMAAGLVIVLVSGLLRHRRGVERLFATWRRQGTAAPEQGFHGRGRPRYAR